MAPVLNSFYLLMTLNTISVKIVRNIEILFFMVFHYIFQVRFLFKQLVNKFNLFRILNFLFRILSFELTPEYI